MFNVFETQEFKNLLVYYKDLADHNAWSKNVGNVMLLDVIPLEYGLTKDLDKGIADLNKQLRAA